MGGTSSTLIPAEKPPPRRDESAYPIVDPIGIGKGMAQGCTWGTEPCQLAVPQGVSASSAKLYRDQGTIRRDQCRRYANDLNKVGQNQKAFEEVKRDLISGAYYEELPGGGGYCRQILYTASDLQGVTSPDKLPQDKVRYPVIRKMSDSGSYSSVTKLFIKPSIPFEVEFNGKPHKVTVLTLMHPSPIRMENIQHDALLTLGDPGQGNNDGLVILIPLAGSLMAGASGAFLSKITQYMMGILRPDPVSGQFESLDIPTGNDWALSSLLPGKPGPGGKTVVTNPGYYVWSGTPPLILAPAGAEQYFGPLPWFGNYKLNRPNIQQYTWQADPSAPPVRYLMLSRPVLVNSMDLQTIRMLPMTPPTEAISPILKHTLSYRTAASCSPPTPSATGPLTDMFSRETMKNPDQCDPFAPGALPAKTGGLALGHILGGILSVLAVGLAIYAAVWLFTDRKRGQMLAGVGDWIGNTIGNLGRKGESRIPRSSLFDVTPEQAAADAERAAKEKEDADRKATDAKDAAEAAAKAATAATAAAGTSTATDADKAAAKAAEDAAKKAAEEKSKADDDAKKAAEEKAKAEEDAKAVTEETAKAEAEAKAEAKAKAEADEKAKADEDAKAKAEAEEKAKADEDAKAKAEAEEKAKAAGETPTPAETQLIATTGQAAEALTRTTTEALALAEQSEADRDTVRELTATPPKTSAEAKALRARVDPIVERILKRAGAARAARGALPREDRTDATLAGALKRLEDAEDEAGEWADDLEKTEESLIADDAKTTDERARVGTSSAATGLFPPDERAEAETAAQKAAEEKAIRDASLRRTTEQLKAAFKRGAEVRKAKEEEFRKQMEDQAAASAALPPTAAATPPAGPPRTLPVSRKTTVKSSGETTTTVDPEGRVDAFVKAVDDFGKLPAPRSVYATEQVKRLRDSARTIAQASSTEQLERFKLASEKLDQLKIEADRADRALAKVETQKGALLKTQAALLDKVKAIKSNPPTRSNPNFIANQRLEGQLNSLLKAFHEQSQALEKEAQELPDLEKQGLLSLVHQSKILEKTLLKEQSERLKALSAQKGWKKGGRRVQNRKSTRRYVA